MLLLLFLLCMIKPYLGTPIAKQGCEERCGNVTIPYPFGIGSKCSIHDGFAITCNHTLSPPKPFLKNTNLEVLDISLSLQLTINNPIISSGCPGIVDSGLPTDLSEIPLSPFSYSTSYNRFVSTSCNHISKLYVDGNVAAGCTSICTASSSGKCDGINCCQITLSYPFKYINASIEKIKEYDDKNNTCKMMFVADYSWIDENWVTNTMGNITHVPAVLGWQNYEGNKTLFKKASCRNEVIDRNTSSSVCYCNDGYGGNPYIGCEECRDGYIKLGNKCIKNEILKFVILDKGKSVAG